MKAVFNYLKDHQARFIEELKELLALKSISTKDEHKKDMQKTAEWIEKAIKKIGVSNVTIHQTEGHPVVFAQTEKIANAPTLLIYGHYDVQPVEPLDLWKTPPFEPTLKGNKLFARGSADDKGQFFIYLKVIEAFLKTKTDLPLNIKLLIEGEEEIGSPSLVPYIKKHKKELSCDTILISDTHMIGYSTPSVTTALRGLTCLEVNVKTSNGDQHSGTYGGTIANPLQVLSEIMVGCKDPKSGKIKIPGFYDNVRKLSAAQRKNLAQTPHDDQKYAKALGSPSVFGEKGFTTLERAGARPTFEINGMWGGYIGEGIKTVLPAEAHAKVSMRLVADQDPKTIFKKVREYILSLAPPHAKVSVKKLENDGLPVMVDPSFEGMKKVSQAVKKVFGKEPIMSLEGGSIPIVADFQKNLKAPAILLGFGLPDDNLHAPNEKFDLRMFERGCKTIATLFDIYRQD